MDVQILTQTFRRFQLKQPASVLFVSVPDDLGSMFYYVILRICSVIADLMASVRCDDLSLLV